MTPEFFGLSDNPFRITPNTSFVFSDDTFTTIVEDLRRRIAVGDCTAVVTGEAGLGKTLLLRRLEQRLAETVPESRVVNLLCSRYASPDTLFEEITERTKTQLGRGRAVLLLDEADTLDSEALQRLIKAVNSSTASMILAGQRGLEERIESRPIAFDGERPIVHHRLRKLKPEEVRRFIAERLAKAEARDPQLFSTEAIQEIVLRARGVPRLINMLCSNAMFFATFASEKRISRNHVLEAAKFLELGPAEADFDAEQEERPESMAGSASAQTSSRPYLQAVPNERGSITENDTGPVPEAKRKIEISVEPEPRAAVTKRSALPLVAAGLAIILAGGAGSLWLWNEFTAEGSRDAILRAAQDKAPELAETATAAPEAASEEAQRPSLIGPQLAALPPLGTAAENRQGSLVLSEPPPQSGYATDALADQLPFEPPAQAGDGEGSESSTNPEELSSAPQEEAATSAARSPAEDLEQDAPLGPPPLEEAESDGAQLAALPDATEIQPHPLPPKRPAAPSSSSAAEPESEASSAVSGTAELMARARRQIAAFRLSIPPGDNAMETLQEVLRQEPENAEALEAIQEVGATYAKLARWEYDGGDRTKAQTYLTRALEIAPQDPSVVALKYEWERIERQKSQREKPVVATRPVPDRYTVETVIPPRNQYRAPRPIEPEDLADVESLRLALDTGADPDGKLPDGHTPLTAAALRNNTRMVDLLLSRGANPRKANGRGVTALSYASQAGNLRAVKLLLDYGANPDNRLTGGRTVLMTAALNGYEAIAQLLLERGADVDAQTDTGWTALMYAAWDDHPALVRLLLDQGSNPLLVNDNGDTALSLANSRGNPGPVELLVMRGGGKG